MKLNKVKVIDIQSDLIVFENEIYLFSDHSQECCENHYLNIDDLTMSDFDGLKFDLTNNNFFERIDGYGIALKPLKGHPVRIAGHGSNNGYYSSKLTLVLTDGRDYTRTFDITECQVID